jgi:hypothetical protein
MRAPAKTYNLISPPVIPVLRDHPERMPRAKVGQQRVMARIRRRMGDSRQPSLPRKSAIPTDSAYDAPESRQWQSVMKELFGNAAPRVADRHTGNLVIPTGDMVKDEFLFLFASGEYVALVTP